MRTLIGLAALTLAGSALAVVALKGDLNGDGKVNKADAQLITRIMVNPNSGTPKQREAADLNGDGKVDIRDTRIALKQAS